MRTIRSILPLFGVLASAILLIAAAARYPGGYEWFGQSISSLFQPSALNGSRNTSRFLAAVAVVVFSSSMAVVFHTIARSGPTRFHRKIIQIAGIASMVYVALVVTPMHDVLVGVALLFFVTAMATIFHLLYLERRLGMLAAGIACLVLTLSNATMYYGQLLYGFLPIVQKVSLVLWVSWLFGLSLRDARTVNRAAEGENQSNARQTGTSRSQDRNARPGPSHETNGRPNISSERTAKRAAAP